MEKQRENATSKSINLDLTQLQLKQERIVDLLTIISKKLTQTDVVVEENYPMITDYSELGCGVFFSLQS